MGEPTVTPLYLSDPALSYYCNWKMIEENSKEVTDRAIEEHVREVRAIWESRQ